MNKKNTPIQVIARAGRLLDVIARQRRAAPLKLLAAEAELHPSTAFRILSSLVAIGFVSRDPAGSYALGIRLQQLGCQVSGQVDIRAVARPLMEQLRDQAGETVNLTVREGDEMVYIERATVSRMMRVEQVIGSRAPLHVTAVGKLMLAEQDARAVAGYAQRSGLTRYTENTLTDLHALQAELERCRLAGYALDDEEAEPGVGCIGVLIRDITGHAVAGLSISSPIERRQEGWVGMLLESGAALSRRLGFEPQEQGAD